MRGGAELLECVTWHASWSLRLFGQELADAAAARAQAQIRRACLIGAR
jgi:hypothetical protein